MLSHQRLWSLWEIMTPFPLGPFIQMAHIWGHFYPDFVTDRGIVAGKWKKSKKIAGDDREKFEDLYAELQRNCAFLELTASYATIQKMRDVLNREDGTYGDFELLPDCWTVLAAV